MVHFVKCNFISKFTQYILWEHNLFVRFGGRLGHAQSATSRASIPSRLCPLGEYGHAHYARVPHRLSLREAPPLCFISLSSKHKGTTTTCQLWRQARACLERNIPSFYPLTTLSSWRVWACSLCKSPTSQLGTLHSKHARACLQSG